MAAGRPALDRGSMMPFDPQLQTWLVLLGAGLSLVLAVVVVVLAVQVRALRRDQRRAFDVGSGEDVVSALGRVDAEVAGLRRDLTTVHANTEHLRELVRGTVSRVGVLRYDAFDDMGGALSFSTALLDERGCGVVVTAINGRSEARCYAKPVVDGESEHHLSSEEEAAIAAAIEGRGPALVAPVRARRRRRVS
ncbi:DUF4446 family protein [Egicoccus halophilus]|uniref:DUF4446 family protein n=1 Tax=Egicoccus halophilus TaxID=1670830 RepID=A0A8J3AAS8_9ACTN|nr:DUF4446 family protein [Egicoccus halophilus]GGI03437.1 hypothetical protein GCM10011354_04030 [Egicoccus halophilus]